MTTTTTATSTSSSTSVTSPLQTTTTTSVSGAGPIFHTAISTPLPHRIVLTEFLPTNPTLWFILVERQIRTHKLVDPEEILGLISSKLPIDVLARASDILESNEDAQATLTRLKQRIISLYRVSDEEKLDELLKDVSLGTKKPSMLLTDMRILSSNVGAKEDLLKRLWLRRLPSRMQEHIAAQQTLPLDALAGVADSLHSIMSTSSQIAAISEATLTTTSTQPVQAPPTSSTQSAIERMERQIEALTAQISALTSASVSTSPQGRSRDCSASPHSRSRSRSRNFTYCWYHYKFGMDAKKCEPPCKFAPPNSSEKPSEN